LIFLDDKETGGLQALVGGEARFALQALAPAADAIIDLPGVNDLGIVMAAEGTIHGN
jgi:hypothetical protein